MNSRVVEEILKQKLIINVQVSLRFRFENGSFQFKNRITINKQGWNTSITHKIYWLWYDVTDPKDTHHKLPHN